MTLLSLASKQIWPQVLAVAHLPNGQMRLRHSGEAAESKTDFNAKFDHTAAHN